MVGTRPMRALRLAGAHQRGADLGDGAQGSHSSASSRPRTRRGRGRRAAAWRGPGRGTGRSAPASRCCRVARCAAMVRVSPASDGTSRLHAGAGGDARSRARGGRAAPGSRPRRRGRAARQAVANSVTTKAAPITHAMWGRGRTDSGMGTACRPSEAARSAANRSAAASAPVVKALTPSSCGGAAVALHGLRRDAARSARGRVAERRQRRRAGDMAEPLPGGQPGRHLGDRPVGHGQQDHVGVGSRAGIALQAGDVPVGGRAITNGMSGTAGSDEHDVHGGVVPLAKDGVLGGKRTILTPEIQVPDRAALCGLPFSLNSAVGWCADARIPSLASHVSSSDWRPCCARSEVADSGAGVDPPGAPGRGLAAVAGLRRVG